jgi:hypothetical protein
MSARRSYRLPTHGDLADIRYHTYAGTVLHLRAALILSYAESNVYESASCEVLHDGDIFWIEAKYVTLFSSILHNPGN